MARAGYCSACGRNCWISADGRCQNGHGPEHVSGVYEVPESAIAEPPEAKAPQPYAFVPSTEPTAEDKKATRSMIFGLVSIAGWCLPILGIPLAGFGLAWGIAGLRSSKRTQAITGIVLCSIFLALAILNAAGGAYLALTGQNPLVNQMFGR